MNLMNLANPMHVAREAAGLAGTVVGAAGTVVGRSVGAGRDVVHRVATGAREPTDAVRGPDRRRSSSRPAPDSPQAAPPLPGADTVAFPPASPAEPPVDVVGAALSGDEGPVTAGGALVEPEGPDLGQEQP